MRRAALTCSLAFAVAVWSGGCTGDGASQTESGAPAGATQLAEATLGPVTATVSHVPAQPTLIDLVELTIEVTYPEGVTVAAPPFSQAFEGRFLVRDFRERDAELDDRGRWHRRFSYSLEPEWSGESHVDGMTLTFTDDRPDAGESRGEHELVIDPFTVEVATVDAGAAPSPAELRPPAPPARLPSEPWSLPTIVAVAAVVLALALGGLWLARRSTAPPPPPPPIPPRVRARMELDQLLRKELLQLGRVQQFYYELTGIVRRFVEGQYGLHAPEQTTEEFLADLAGSGAVDETLATRLRGFLEAADLVKYAAQIPGEGAAADSVDRARTIIDHEPAAAAQHHELAATSSGSAAREEVAP